MEEERRVRERNKDDIEEEMRQDVWKENEEKEKKRRKEK